MWNAAFIFGMEIKCIATLKKEQVFKKSTNFDLKALWASKH